MKYFIMTCHIYLLQRFWSLRIRDMKQKTLNLQTIALLITPLRHFFRPFIILYVWRGWIRYLYIIPFLKFLDPDKFRSQLKDLFFFIRQSLNHHPLVPALVVEPGLKVRTFDLKTSLLLFILLRHFFCLFIIFFILRRWVLTLYIMSYTSVLPLVRCPVNSHMIFGSNVILLFLH